MSAASQAVGPPGSDFEMACAGRSFASIGRKLLPRTALAGQKIAASDSVLGPVRPQRCQPGPDPHLPAACAGVVPGRTLECPRYISTRTGALDVAGFTQDERNFSLFWGLAVDAYERTLISNLTRFDKGQLTADEQAGLAVFTGQGPDSANPNAPAGGKCVNCHTGPLFSAAARPPRQPNERVERMIMGDDGVAFYDNGFYNIGVTPTQEDLGVGGTDPWGNPLSFTRQHVAGRRSIRLRLTQHLRRPVRSGDCGRRASRSTAPSRRRACATSRSLHLTSTMAASARWRRWWSSTTVAVIAAAKTATTPPARARSGRVQFSRISASSSLDQVAAAITTRISRIWPVGPAESGLGGVPEGTD